MPTIHILDQLIFSITVIVAVILSLIIDSVFFKRMKFPGLPRMENMPSPPEKKKRPIDNVTTENLDITLRMCSIKIDKMILIRIIDLIKLIEEKGGETSIDDVTSLQIKWTKKE